MISCGERLLYQDGTVQFLGKILHPRHDAKIEQLALTRVTC